MGLAIVSEPVPGARRASSPDDRRRRTEHPGMTERGRPGPPPQLGRRQGGPGQTGALAAVIRRSPLWRTIVQPRTDPSRESRRILAEDAGSEDANGQKLR